jgi:hypothetical protein
LQAHRFGKEPGPGADHGDFGSNRAKIGRFADSGF